MCPEPGEINVSDCEFSELVRIKINENWKYAHCTGMMFPQATGIDNPAVHLTPRSGKWRKETWCGDYTVCKLRSNEFNYLTLVLWVYGGVFIEVIHFVLQVNKWGLERISQTLNSVRILFLPLNILPGMLCEHITAPCPFPSQAGWLAAPPNSLGSCSFALSSHRCFFFHFLPAKISFVLQNPAQIPKAAPIEVFPIF